jgi:hypothetical protein
MAAKKKNNQGNILKKDFKHYNKTFGNFSLWDGRYYCLLSLFAWGLLDHALIRRLRKS